MLFRLIAVAMTALVETNSLAMQRFKFRTHQYAILFLYCVLFFLLSSCSPNSIATPFIAPRSSTTIKTSTPIIAAALPTSQTTIGSTTSPTPEAAQESLLTPEATSDLQPTTLPFPTISPSETLFPVPTSDLTATPLPPQTCSDSLRYIQDINYPDGTNVTAGQPIAKQWMVENNGTCDWNDQYRLKLLDGYTSLNAPGDISLGTVTIGSQITITINFTAPSLPGPYRTAWQAYNPDGIAFGDAIYMEINVGQ